MQITGSDFIIQFLAERGVPFIAGMPGGTVLPLYEALGRQDRVGHVLVRHEQGAGFIAQGYARATGRAGVCLATSGPGATNLLTAIADAQMDSVPLVCLSGQVPRALIGTQAFQEVAICEMAEPVTKACFAVRDAADLPQLLAEAFRIAESGRPGPVLVEIPKDIQTARFDYSPDSPVAATPTEVPPCPEQLDQAAALIRTAQRPVLYLGGGVVKARAWREARLLAERAGLPTTMTLMALGTLPDGHPLSIGMLGMHGARYTNQAIHECDLLICIGARFDDRATGRLADFAPQARVIHVDVDAHELGKLRHADVAIHADAAAALRGLLARAEANLRTAWRQRIAALKAEGAMPMPGADDPRRPFGLIRAAARLAGPDAWVTTDVGQHQMWVAQAYPFMRPDRWLTSGGLGTMGFGLPAAIGAALAHPGEPVVCFTGDGSLLINNQELATLSELDLPVKIVLLDNASLGLVCQQQNLFYGRRLTASRYSRPTDFCALAEAFGIAAFDVGKATDVAAYLHAAFSTSGPALIRVPIAQQEQVLPMVVPGQSNLEVIQ